VSLRMRLLLAITGSVLVGLAIAGSVTYALLRSYLIERVDAQLGVAQELMVHRLVDPGSPTPPSGELVPAGTVGEVVMGGRITVGPEYLYGRAAGPPAVGPSAVAVDGPAIFSCGAVGDATFH
jgi:hypothetical protein